MITPETIDSSNFLANQAMEISDGGAQTNRWMGILAHELRNPLNAIIMALEELHPFCAGEPSARVAREMAKAKVAQMTRIIEDVLDLCRARPGNIPLGAERVELAVVVSAAIQTVRPIMMAKSHHLTLLLPPGPVILYGRRSRLEQILTNLLTNAANYTHPCGRIRLTVDLAPGTVTLRVRDNGIGIEPQLLPHIFDPYRRGPATQGCHVGGLGIGLALVKSFVELHGGTVAAHSDGLATGSEFVVSLPMAGVECVDRNRVQKCSDSDAKFRTNHGNDQP